MLSSWGCQEVKALLAKLGKAGLLRGKKTRHGYGLLVLSEDRLHERLLQFLDLQVVMGFLDACQQPPRPSHW